MSATAVVTANRSNDAQAMLAAIAAPAARANGSMSAAGRVTIARTAIAPASRCAAEGTAAQEFARSGLSAAIAASAERLAGRAWMAVWGVAESATAADPADRADRADVGDVTDVADGADALDTSCATDTAIAAAGWQVTDVSSRPVRAECAVLAVFPKHATALARTAT